MPPPNTTPELRIWNAIHAMGNTALAAMQHAPKLRDANRRRLAVTMDALAEFIESLATVVIKNDKECKAAQDELDALLVDLRAVRRVWNRTEEAGP